MDDLMVILGFPVHPSFAGESIGESFSHWFHRERPWDLAEDSCERRRGREAKGARGRGSPTKIPGGFVAYGKYMQLVYNMTMINIKISSVKLGAVFWKAAKGGHPLINI